MMTQFAFALRDVRRRPVVFVFFAIQLVVVLLFLPIVAQSAITSSRHIRIAESMADNRMVFFSQTLGTFVRRSVTPDGARWLSSALDENLRAYSVVSSIKLREHPDLAVVVGVGAFSELLQLKGHDSMPAGPVALIGNNVGSLRVGDYVSFGERNTKDILVHHRLPRGANYIARGTPQTLDNSLVILTSAESIMGFFYVGYHHFDEILVNTSLIRPSGADLLYFVSGVREMTGVALHPIELNDYSQQHHGGAFYGAVFFLVFFAITSAYVLVGIVVNIVLLLENHMSEYAIHLLSGARLWHLYARVFIYITLLVGPPLLLASILLRSMYQAPWAQLFGAIPLLGGLVSIIAVVPIIKLRKSDIFLHLRGD